VYVSIDLLFVIDAVMQKEIDALKKFCAKLRAIPDLSAAVFVFFIEANHCWVRAKDLAMHAAGFKPMEIESEKEVDGHPVPGVWMTAHQKDQLNKHANFFLKQEKMHMLSVNHPDHPLVLLEDAEPIIRKFGDQLRMYRQRNYTPADASKESKVAYTGKGAGMCDDMVMAWGIALWWGANFLNEEKVDKYGVPRVNVVVESYPELKQSIDVT
jgi:hypothetical protein